MDGSFNPVAEIQLVETPESPYGGMRILTSFSPVAEIQLVETLNSLTNRKNAEAKELKFFASNLFRLNSQHHTKWMSDFIQVTM